MIRCADWIIDLGPEGGNKGGEIVVTGTPDEVAEHPTSHTGRYLKQVLRSIRRRWWQVEWWSESGVRGLGEGLGVAWLGWCLCKDVLRSADREGKV